MSSGEAWVYYYRHLGRYAEKWDTLDEAMVRADYIEADGIGSIEAVVDSNGKEYNMEAVWQYMRERPKPSAVAEPEDEEPEYRHFRDLDWLRFW